MVLVLGGFNFDIFMIGLEIGIDVDLFKIFGYTYDQILKIGVDLYLFSILIHLGPN